MSKRMSLYLGILASATSAIMIYGCVRIVLFIQHPNMDFGDGEMAITWAAMVMLGAIFLLFLLGGATILFSIGIPHYFLYLKDKHKSSYLYLVKYISAIPSALCGFWFMIWVLPLLGGHVDPRTWTNLGVTLAIGGPFTILALLTSDQKFSRPKIKHHE